VFDSFFTHSFCWIVLTGACVRIDFSSQGGAVVVVADCNNCRLALWYLGHGIVWKHLGSRGTQPGQFTFPRTVVVTGDGTLVVTDKHRVQVLTVDGAVLCVFGGCDPVLVADFDRLGPNLSGVAVCGGTDEILVTDFINHCVVAIAWSPPAANVRPFFQPSIISNKFECHFLVDCIL